ncbi:MAG: NADH-quinone oxidoreductase subunit C [Oligoflexia bacterium]|nr:NADH-quinone oxidoreductase subunit C [Oligoflexia bacterium]
MKEQLQERLRHHCTAEGLTLDRADPRQWFVDGPRERVRDFAAAMVTEGARYVVSMGYDEIARNGTLGLVHSFAFDREGLFLHFRTNAPAADPSFESITPDIPNAGWSEREYMDLLGLKFSGHPKPKRLVLADDWPEGIYPLRKEVPHDLVPPAAEDVAYQLEQGPPGTTTIPIGPYHPCLHEPEHFAVYVDGETIKGCDYRGFMTHRGIEKLCTTAVSYNEVPYIAERICGICGTVHATAYSQAVERAAGIRIPRRAEFIRTMMLEIERIHSHLLWLGVAGHLIGFDTVFMQAWRVREQIMWLCERLTGNRKTYGMVQIGGVRRDVTPEIREDILGVIGQVEKELLVIRKAIQNDSSIHRRTKGVGTLSHEEAVRWSLVGPVARARGVDIDVRRDHPYAAYDEVRFEVPVFTGCDAWSTLQVRMIETFEAIRIIRQVLEKMPGGPILFEFQDPIAPGLHAMSAVEAPRGESTHYIITGENNRAERWRVRAPTYPNLQAVPLMLLDEQFADFPIIVGSIDPCFSCTDRVGVVNARSGGYSVMTRFELEALGRRKGESV